MATNPVLTLSDGGTAGPRPEHTVRVSAIDIGSNSIRQTIADVSPTGVIRVVDEMKAAPRLGAGLTERGMLSEVAIQNALVVLGRMATLAKQLEVERTEVIATSAVRDARNGEAFLKLAREETGLGICVLGRGDEGGVGIRQALAHFELAIGR